MENIIFCFSGTGNSLAVAREIANHTGDTEIILIADLMEKDYIDLPYERVGIVCPAYFSSLPPIIEQFVKKLDFKTTKYTYAVVTAGALHGSSFNRLSELIGKQSGRLSGTYALQMPGNYIAMYSAWPKVIQSHLHKKAKRKIAEISESIIEMKHTSKGNGAGKPVKSLNEKMNDYSIFALDYSVNSLCNGCGVCIKICPMNNVKMVDQRPVFGGNCARCMACIQWCPMMAINYQDKTERRKRYTHPDIKAVDLYVNRL